MPDLSTDPTPRQLEILRVIVAAWHRGGPMPSLREVSQATGMRAATGCHDQLVLLERKGTITRRGRAGLGIVIAHPAVADILAELGDPRELDKRRLGFVGSGPATVRMRATRGEYVSVKPPKRRK